MLKKLIILNILFVFIFSTVVFASSMLIPDNRIPFSSVSIQNNTAESQAEVPSHFSKSYVPSDNGTLSYVVFLKPEKFDEPISSIRDSFGISVRALSDDIVIKLLVYDEKDGRFVPVTRNIFDDLTATNIVINTSWKFGPSGFLLCTFKMPAEGTYDYRLLIHKAGLLEEGYVIDTNLQIVDFTVNYKKAVSFESVLYNSFWDIYFDMTKYSLPLLP